MKTLRIDFAAPSLRRSLFHTCAFVWTLALLAGVLVIGALLVGWQLRVQQEKDEQQLHAARQRASIPAPTRAQLPRISEAQVSAVNGAVLQLNLPWGELHDAIAAASSGSIALLVLEPDARKSSIRLSGEARNSDDMIAYIERLKRQELFVVVTLIHHEIIEQDANHPIRFQLDVQWSIP